MASFNKRLSRWRLVPALALAAGGGSAMSQPVVEPQVTSGASGASGAPRLPPVSVSAPRDAAPPTSTTHHVTTITARDIEQSASTSLAEVLATEANLVLQSFYGNDKYTAIDIRGMGDTATSNVLVLVDGVKLNENDLSAADLSTVGLSQIERIEVLRGGGSVLYGPGAVGGVIHITTRRPQPGPMKITSQVRTGSYGARGAQASIEGGTGQVAGRLQLDHAESDGFRRNSELHGHKVSGEARWLPQNEFGWRELYARASLSKDRYGFPGPLPLSVLDGSTDDRRQTRTPNDNGSSQDQRLILGTLFDWNQAGRLELRFTDRDRRNPYLMGFEPIAGFPVDQQIDNASNRIHSTSRQWEATYQVETLLGGLPQNLTVGSTWGRGEYLSTRSGLTQPQERMSGRARTRSGFLDVVLMPAPGLRLHAGYREDRLKVRQAEDQLKPEQDYLFDPVTEEFTPIGEPTYYYESQAQRARDWRNQGAELGASWRLTPAWEPFVGISRHVRQPNLDELALSTIDLKPQRGSTTELGMRYEPSRQFKASITAFVMEIDDEIYFGRDERTGDLAVNRNYPWHTRRDGFELEGRWLPHPDLTLRAQWAHVRPRFPELDTDVPLVPRDSVNASVQWRFQPHWQWTLNARHVGKRHDGNDWQNRLASLGAYKVVDTALRWERAGWSASVGVNNLFGEVYTTKAYDGTVYPMPERTAYVMLGWRH